MLGGCDGNVLGGNNGYCNTCAASATCSALFGADIDWYWSSSLYFSAAAWVVVFDNGAVGTDFFASEHSVRCVRSGP